MMSDSIVNGSAPNASKDFGKKKRANRSAKLKQCKLDARREQWLSQVKNNKGCEDEVNGNGVAVVGGELNGSTRKKAPIFKDLELKSPSLEENEIHHDSDSESSSHANSPTSSTSGGNDSGTNYSGISSSSSSISSSFGFSCGGSYSGSITEEEEEEGGGGGCADDGCLDDWEIMADALAAATTPNDKERHNPAPDLAPNTETGSGLGLTTEPSSPGSVGSHSERSKPEGAGILGKGAAKNRAWRPDDASRPQTLPNLSKQHSFPARHSCHVVNPWVRNNVPTSCPICCEDLDLTDSSFLPCSCGFRLCLFCHKRILEEDGRCPGCRKPYAADPVEKEASVSGGSLTVRLARSCSMFSRV
ncbi:hypothetical protein Cgig2_006193 [Carnegiea gigantea]|uniref:RING-type domain-containing protein n=1 Tax=Carnegiea gigantea TaxID=171969 RepID=A0A9Q1L0S1_9CARY|nr:hypothetical protein Cgig2_006193 [Carnegiea gigantea]